MSKKTMILGYTRSGHEVLLPTHKAPDMSLFGGWTPGDHLDASRILVEHGEREVEPFGPWCMRWAKEHWSIGKRGKKRARKGRFIRGGAEVTIRTIRRR
jgi:hypothetical protein